MIADANTEPQMLRLFVAISVPDDVKDQIERTQRELQHALPGNFVRWTRREQFHLTLKFLGNVTESQIKELIGTLRTACLNFAALRLRAERIGFFPDIRFPRVVWVWAHDAGDILPRLQQAVETGTKNSTREKSEGKFTGHVTLGRIQGIKRPQAEILAKLALGMTDRFFGEWLADKVELFRSELWSNGSRYTTLAAIPLSGKT